MAVTTNKNYLQPTGFKIVINRQNYPNMEYFASGVTHPGATVNAIELPIRRVTSVPIAGDKIEYGSLTVDMILDEDMEAYKEIQNWLERIVNEGHVRAEASPTSTVVPTYADITVIILTSQNNKNVQIKYKDCVPTTLGSIEFTSTAGDVTYPVTAVTFRFSSFEIE